MPKWSLKSADFENYQIGNDLFIFSKNKLFIKY